MNRISSCNRRTAFNRFQTSTDSSHHTDHIHSINSDTTCLCSLLLRRYSREGRTTRLSCSSGSLVARWFIRMKSVIYEDAIRGRLDEIRWSKPTRNTAAIITYEIVCTNNLSVIKECRHYFSISLPSELLCKRTGKFLLKLPANCC